MKVEILDSTLREGEQTPGISFSLDEKIEIAKLLDTFGVEYIEAGHPIVTDDIKKGVKQIAHENLNADILAHCRALKSDIDAAIDCDVDWVGIFFSVSKKSLKKRFGISKEEAIEKITEAVQYAKDHGLNVRYTPEDTARTDINRVITMGKAAIEAGADRISIADTTGCMSPLDMQQFINTLQNQLTVPLHVHCHNDLGMATANALVALKAGAKVVDVTVNGIGERTGIPALAEVTTALKTLYDVNNDWDLEMLPKLSETVEKYSNIKQEKLAPVTGDYAFTHNAGLHVSAMLEDPSFYEAIPCEMVGGERHVVVDKLAGKATMEYKLKELGIQPRQSLVNGLLAEIKERNVNRLNDAEVKKLVRTVKHGNPR